MRLKVIITGATGMVGEGVLHECLLHQDVESVLLINRRPCNVLHPKLTEIIHDNFFDFSAIENKLAGYNACFFCLGVSSIGMNEQKYNHVTYDLTMAFASVLAKLNPQITFTYVSGVGTDSTEKGRTMWARVKGKTENKLMELFPKKAFMFRPGFIQPTKGLKNTYKIYMVLGFLYPLFKLMMPRYVTTLKEVGLAMINAAIKGYDTQILECSDIVKLAQK
jgi:Predicted nucleoside-diphosphate-sugar epimerases